MGRTRKNSQRYKPEDAPIKYANELDAQLPTVDSTNSIEGSGENVNIGEQVPSEGVQNKAQYTAREKAESKEPESEPKITCTFSDDFLNKTLVCVRIIGDKNGRNGMHNMCIANIAKAVVTNVDIDRAILVSQKTADAIYDLIVDFPNKIGIAEMSREARVVIAERFWSNLRRYGFLH